MLLSRHTRRREFITLLVTRAVVLRDPSGALASGLLRPDPRWSKSTTR
jgi:hypothetical protein